MTPQQRNFARSLTKEDMVVVCEVGGISSTEANEHFIVSHQSNGLVYFRASSYLVRNGMQHQISCDIYPIISRGLLVIFNEETTSFGRIRSFKPSN